MKYLGFCLFIFSSITAFGQVQNSRIETFPIFLKCEEVSFDLQENCFKQELFSFVIENFEEPEIVAEENYSGEINVLFEVTKKGEFEVIYVNAAYNELKEEIKRVFSTMPQVTAATYNGNPSYIQYRLPVRIPITRNLGPILPEIPQDSVKVSEVVASNSLDDIQKVKRLDEYDNIVSEPFVNREYNSNILIPLSKERYSRFDAEMNAIGNNAHTASKPYLFKEVSKYYDFEAETEAMLQERKTWVGRKIWNEHLVRFQGENYWFTGDVVVDLSLGKDFSSDKNFTYNNTRGAIFQGGLGKNFNFYTVVFESQARFADYFNRYANSIAPYDSPPAIIPGRGIAKEFMNDSYDFPVAEGYVSYSPSEFFNVQFGQGQNFIGDGYRSLLESDIASPYTYLKFNTQFWKLKYTNTYMSLRDVRREVAAEGSYRVKYMANHYLSLNLTKRFNIGLFESVIWQNDNGRGFDLSYLNPVIFYRSIEFSTGQNGGNAIIGMTAKYKFSDQINFYGQWVIDEFSTSEIFGGKQSWKNKLGYQLGIKYFDAFKIQNLFLQAEYNQVRPYTYSHNDIVLNYGHNNQSLAHPWGANFREFVLIGHYKKERWYGNGKIILGKRGFDFNTVNDSAYYGGNIYRSERERPYDSGVKVGQGNTTKSLFAELEAGYIINPVTNLKLFGSVIYRDFNPTVNTKQNFENNTVWLNIGVRTDIFNWYYDY